MRILFVCTANICRSVMAQALFNNHVRGRASGISMIGTSAGIEARVGLPPHAYTLEICRNHNLDVSSHMARQLTPDMLEEASVVLCMETLHRDVILGAYPHLKDKVFLLTAYLQRTPPENLSIADPTGKSLRNYQSCFQIIESEILRVITMLNE